MGSHAMPPNPPLRLVVLPAVVRIGIRFPRKFFTGSRREWAAPQLVGGGVLVRNFPECFRCRTIAIGQDVLAWVMM